MGGLTAMMVDYGGNTVNNSYSPYNGDADVHSPLLPLQAAVTCELLLLSCGVCSLDKEPPDA